MKRTILIYDDNEEILFPCKLIFERYRYIAETKTHCDNIIEEVQQLKPDIILLDLLIPGTGGVAALRLLKMNEAISHIPVLFFSAINSVNIITHEEQADGYIRKPFDINELVETISKKIADKQALWQNLI